MNELQVPLWCKSPLPFVLKLCLKSLLNLTEGFSSQINDREGNKHTSQALEGVALL